MHWWIISTYILLNIVWQFWLCYIILQLFCTLVMCQRFIISTPVWVRFLVLLRAKHIFLTKFKVDYHQATTTTFSWELQLKGFSSMETPQNRLSHCHTAVTLFTYEVNFLKWSGCLEPPLSFVRCQNKLTSYTVHSWKLCLIDF